MFKNVRMLMHHVRCVLVVFRRAVRVGASSSVLSYKLRCVVVRHGMKRSIVLTQMTHLALTLASRVLHLLVHLCVLVA